MSWHQPLRCAAATVALWLLALSGVSPAAAVTVAPEVNIATGDVPGASINPFTSGWKEVKPDAALKKKLERYKRAQTRTHTQAVAAGFAPASIDARDATGNLTSFYIDFQDGDHKDSNAFAGRYAGVRSVWYNHSGFLERETDTDNLYTVSHEFFHALFNPVAVKQGLWEIPVATRLKWMSEGIPTAAGQIAMEGFEGTSLAQRAYAGSRHGVRALGARYLDFPLDLRDQYPLPASGMWFGSESSDQTAELLSYPTSSFWLHVARASGGLRWIKTFIDRPPPASKTTGGWVDWAEKGIQLGGAYANLADAYNSYIASFVDYPYLNKTSEKDYFAWGKWQTLLFHEGCRTIELQAGGPAVSHVATIRPLSAECVKIKVTGLPAKAANILVTLAGATDRQCADVHVISGRKTPLQMPIVELDKTCTWNWQYLYDPLTANAKGEQVFVITNVRPDKPSLTTQLNAVDFKFSVPALKVTASGTVPAASSGGPAPVKKLPVPSRVSTKAESVALLGFNVAESASARAAAGCDAETQALRPCPPHTKLALAWGDTADLAVDVLQAQYGALGGDFTAIGKVMDQLPATLMKQGQVSGARVELRFPRIQPGFSGSFNNAIIELNVDHLGQSGSQEALSSRYLHPGMSPTCPHSGAQYPHAGKVTIDQFDANGISGSFSAEFFDAPEEGCPVPRKIASVSGRFRTPPVLDEAQSEYAESADGDKRLKALMVQKFYAMVPAANTPMNRAEVWARFTKEQARSGSGSSGSGSGVSTHEGVACTCDCAEFESPRRDACAGQCLAYGPIAAECTAKREIARGRKPEIVAKAINACPTDCPSLNGPLSPVCADAAYPLRRACQAAGPGGISAKQVDCYIRHVVRELPEPQKSDMRRQLTEQISAMDRTARDQYMGLLLDVMKADGMNCPAT